MLTQEGKQKLKNLLISNEQFEEDLIYFTAKLTHHLPFFSEINEERKIALLSLCINLGTQVFLNFRPMIDALSHQDYAQASKEILDKWAQQIGEIATTPASIILTGNI